MNNTIRDRDELLLAKIAGENVDIKTMTPGVASSLKEKLMLDIADRLDEIESHGGGSELPGVTSEDNGKHLTVVDGVWGAALPTDRVFVATYTLSGTTYTCDKTFAEIIAAHNAGKVCVARTAEDVGGGTIMEVQLPLNTILKINGTASTVGYDTSIISALDGSLMVVNLTHVADGTINKSTYTATQQQ